MEKVNVAFSMIIFNSDYVLDAVLESIYPCARQIVITEGPVKYYIDQGFTTSTDNTVEIIRSFPDPERKITLIQGQWSEKKEMMQAQTPFVHPDTEFVWMVDADEVYKKSDMAAVFKMLPQYDSVGFRSLSFFGGFGHILTGFEQKAEYHRIQRWSAEGWHRHRPPTILNPESGQPWRAHRHLSFERLAARRIYIYHYTYVYPLLVKRRARYYHEALARNRCIPNWYECLYKPWVFGTKKQRQAIEDRFDGVHEFLPKYRGPCRTAPFRGQHPKVVVKRLPELRRRLQSECAGEHL